VDTVTLILVLHGLVALAPANAPNPTNHMTALVEDADASMQMNQNAIPAAVMNCMSGHVPTHAPLLQFDLADTTQCVAANCTLSGSTCQCPAAVLTGKEILFAIPTTPPPSTPQTLSGLADSPLPHLSTATSMTNVADLAQPPYNLTLNPAFLSSSPPALLLARMSFDFDTVDACSLAAREDEGQLRVVSMTPRLIGARGNVGEQSQALAQMVVARRAVPDSASAGFIVMTLHPFAVADTSQDLQFTLFDGPDGYRVDLSNDSTAMLPDDPCDDGVARHVALYADLAANPPIFTNRLVPHVKFITSALLTDLTQNPDPCSLPDFNVSNRPICPMAIFE
jgi:hypothetical protein